MPLPHSRPIMIKTDIKKYRKTSIFLNFPRLHILEGQFLLYGFAPLLPHSDQTTPSNSSKVQVFTWISDSTKCSGGALLTINQGRYAILCIPAFFALTTGFFGNYHPNLSLILAPLKRKKRNIPNHFAPFLPHSEPKSD